MAVDGALIAATVLIAGDGRSPFNAAGCDLARVPIWAFHGDADGVVPVEGTIQPVNEFNGSSNVMSYLVRVTSQFSVRPRGGLELTDIGFDATDAGADAFARRCGTHYVRAIRYGSELYLLIKLSSESESTTAELEAQLDSDGSVAGASLDGSFGTKLSQAASREDVNVSMELASRGFALPTAEGEGSVLAELTSGEVSERMFEAMQQVRSAMIESTEADIETLSSEQADGLVRINSTPTAVSASLYSSLANWPGFAEDGVSYSELVQLSQDNEHYLRELGAQMDRMSRVYYGEIAPFLEAQGAARAAYQTRDGLDAVETTNALVELAETWADNFQPPSAASSSVGHVYGGVERDFSQCWLASGENPLHDCQDGLEPGWDDHTFINAHLENYHRERVVPMRYWAGADAMANYSSAADACERREFSARFGGGRGRLPTQAEAETMANLVAAGNLDWSDADITHAIYYLESDEDGSRG